MADFLALFAWPGWSNVYPNLIASIIWGPLVVAGHFVLSRRSRGRALAHQATHMVEGFAREHALQTDRLIEHVSAVHAKQTDLVLEHVTAANVELAKALTPTPRAPRVKATVKK